MRTRRRPGSVAKCDAALLYTLALDLVGCTSTPDELKTLPEIPNTPANDSTEFRIRVITNNATTIPSTRYVLTVWGGGVQF
jgi:starvation-inducible outer membrane lipoprotein